MKNPRETPAKAYWSALLFEFTPVDKKSMDESHQSQLEEAVRAQIPTTFLSV